MTHKMIRITNKTEGSQVQAPVIVDDVESYEGLTGEIEANTYGIADQQLEVEVYSYSRGKKVSHLTTSILWSGEHCVIKECTPW